MAAGFDTPNGTSQRGGFPVRATRSQPGTIPREPLNKPPAGTLRRRLTDTVPPAERRTPPERCHRGELCGLLWSDLEVDSRHEGGPPGHNWELPLLNPGPWDRHGAVKSNVSLAARDSESPACWCGPGRRSVDHHYRPSRNRPCP